MDFSPWAPPPAQLELGPDHLHLWLIGLDVAAAEIDRARRVLSQDEIERAARFHFERDARRYTVAHGALRSILGRYAGLPAEALAFTITPYGKPYLRPDACSALPDLNFNLSHSGEFALVGVCRFGRLGVDIELERPDFANGEIAERFFSHGEVRDLNTLPPDQRVPAFFRCWTRKEAFVKARGEGLSLPLNGFDVSLLPGQPPALLRVADEVDRVGRWSLHAAPLPSTMPYQAAAAVEGTVSELRLFRFLRIP